MPSYWLNAWYVSYLLWLRKTKWVFSRGGKPWTLRDKLSTLFTIQGIRKSPLALYVKSLRENCFLKVTYINHYYGLYSKIENKLKHIAKSKLSWCGRLVAIKINAIPQILYVFRSLPIPVPTHYFTSLSKTLKSYVWQNHKAGCSHSCLIKHRSLGGVGFPDIKDYYWALQWDQLKHWFVSSSPLWADIECYFAPTSDLYSFLLSDIWKPWNLKYLTTPMQASLLAWRHLISAPSSSRSPTHVTFPLQILETMIPSPTGKPLLTYGIQEANALLKHNALFSLEELVNKYHIPVHHHFLV